MSHIQMVHLDQWQIAQKGTMVCKDLIYYLVKQTSCDVPILWETTTSPSSRRRECVWWHCLVESTVASHLA